MLFVPLKFTRTKGVFFWQRRIMALQKRELSNCPVSMDVKKLFCFKAWLRGTAPSSVGGKYFNNVTSLQEMLTKSFM